MINANKFLSRNSTSTLSTRSILGLGIIRSDSKKIDNLLKERLVLSKVRYGIERQRLERERRRNRETSLENDAEQNYEISDFSKDNSKRRDGKPKRGLGFFMGTVLRTVVSSIGGLAFAAIPRFNLINDKVIKSGTNFNKTIGGTGGLLNSIKSQRGPFDKLRKIDLKPVRNIGKTITGFGNSLQFFVTSAIAGQVSGRAIDKFRTPMGAGVGMGAQAQASQKLTKSQIEMRKILERNRMRQRAEELQRVREESVVAETAKRKSRSRSRRSKVEVETAVGSPSRKITKKNIKINNPEYARTGGGTPRSPIDDFINADDPFNVKKKSVNINKFINKPIFTIDGIQYEFDNDLITKSGVFNDNYIPKEIKTITNPDGSISTLTMLTPRQRRISQFFRQANDIHDMQNVAFGRDLSLMKPDDLKYMAKDILKDDITSPEFQKAFNDYKNEFNLIKRLEKKLIKPENIRGKKRVNRSKVTVSGRPGQKVFTRPDGTITYRSGGLTNQDLFSNAGQRSTRNMFRDIDKIKSVKASKVTGKKGLGKFMANIGGAQFLQPIKKFLGETIGAIPLIGDLIAFLIDIFVFGEPPGRAAFMAIGSILGGFLGGLAGSIGGPPGVFLGGLIGGIGGDLLGGAFYNLLFGGGQSGFGERAPKSILKSGVKAGLATGGIATLGKYMLGEEGPEMVIDADSTKKIEEVAPGFLAALNDADAGEVPEVLNSYASYEGTAGRERLVPVPVPQKEETGTQDILIMESPSMVASSPFSQHYRRG